MGHPRAIEIPPGVALTEPISREFRSRGNKAFIIRDALTNDLILTQKLTAAVDHLNAHYARSPFEHVSVHGLYQSASNHNGYTGGYHKMRYLVTLCELDKAHIAFEQARSLGAQKATVLTEVPVN